MRCVAGAGPDQVEATIEAATEERVSGVARGDRDPETRIGRDALVDEADQVGDVEFVALRMLGEIDLLLVIGSRNSSNSNRLVDVARAAGVPSYLIDDEAEIDVAWLDGIETVGITSGASAPERLVTRVCDWFRAQGVERIESHRMVDEDVTFRLPVELRRELQLADSQPG